MPAVKYQQKNFGLCLNADIKPAATGFTANLPGFVEMLDAARSIFDALLRAVEALEHFFLAFCAEFLTAISTPSLTCSFAIAAIIRTMAIHNCSERFCTD